MAGQCKLALEQSSRLGESHAVSNSVGSFRILKLTLVSQLCPNDFPPNLKVLSNRDTHLGSANHEKRTNEV